MKRMPDRGESTLRTATRSRHPLAQMLDPMVRNGAVPVTGGTRVRSISACPCGSGCPRCQAKPDNLNISRPNDPAEIEADAIATKVMRIPVEGEKPIVKSDTVANTVHRKCSVCEQGEEENNIRQRALPLTLSVPDQTPEHVRRVIESGGSPLDAETRTFFEPRFGFDLSSVRIHLDFAARQSAHAINARAYTLGSNIVFGGGEYQPENESGKRLIAHELAHTIQQKQSANQYTIHRCPDAASLTDYDARVAAIRTLREFSGLNRTDRRMAEDIITTSRDRDDCTHMIERLETLFATPVDQSAAVGAAASAIMASAADIERDRLASLEGARLRNLQEDMAASSSRNWETLTSPPGSDGDGTTFRIDRSDPNNIIVQVKIRVTGNPTDVANIVAQEDGIERGAQELGYTLDVIFVTRGGGSVYTVSVDPRLPVTSGNWSAYDPNPSAYTHEIHHLLGLDDRYDYTVHASNTRVNIHDRLFWFQVEAHRAPDPAGAQSLMGTGQHLRDDDICRVSQLNFASCMSGRQTRRDAITRARGGAFSKAFRVFEILSGIRPIVPVFGASDMRELQVRRIVSMANNIFGISIAQDSLAENIGDMRHRLTPGISVEPMPSADSNCTGNAHYVVDMRPPIRLCPEFFRLSTDDQGKTFLRAAAQMVRLDNSLPVSLCASSDCSTQCGGFNNADTWAKYVTCASGVI